MRVGVVDDVKPDREAIAVWLVNIDEEAIQFEQPVGTPEDLFRRVQELRLDALLIDYQITSNNYSRVSGVQLVAAMIKRQIPAVLVTSYRRSDMTDILQLGRYVPTILRKNDLDENNLPEALNVAAQHVAGNVSPEMRAYPTIVRIDTIEDDRAFLVVPALNGNPGISAPVKFLREKLGCDPVPLLRFEADVNIGVADHDLIYLDNPRQLPPVSTEYAALLRH